MTTVEERLASLERDVAQMKTALAWYGQPRTPGAGHRPATPPPASVDGERQAVKPDRPRAGAWLEEDVISRLFPVIGALALLIGAGFGFRFAIDQGWIGPVGRVLLGAVAGFALIGLGEWTRKRDWASYAAAVSGGGTAVLYLSLWAALHRYSLVSPETAFLLLMVVTSGAICLSLRHDSQILALIGVGASFVNPAVVGSDALTGQATFAYVLALDIAVLAIATSYRWHILNKVAFAGSWFLLVSAGTDGTAGATFATAIFLLFFALPFLAKLAGRQVETRLIAANAFFYWSWMFYEIWDSTDHAWFTFALGSFHLAGAVAAKFGTRNRVVTTWNAAVALVLFATWAFLAFDLRTAVIVWAVQAVLVIGVGMRTNEPSTRLGAAGLILLSLWVQSLRMSDGIHMSALLWNAEATVFVVQILALCSVLILLRSAEDETWRVAAAVAAHAVALAWLSVEAREHLAGGSVADAEASLVGLAYSTIWGLYAAVLLVAGLVRRSRSARVTAVAIFGVTLVKMTLHDLWMLGTLQRLIGFLAIGSLLLACSLMFNRFKELIGSDGSEGSLST